MIDALIYRLKGGTWAAVVSTWAATPDSPRSVSAHGRTREEAVKRASEMAAACRFGSLPDWREVPQGGGDHEVEQ